MGGVEDGIIWSDADYSEAEHDLLVAARREQPEKFGHIVFASEIPQPQMEGAEK